MSAVLRTAWASTELGQLLVAGSDAGLCFVGLRPETAADEFRAWSQRFWPEAEITSADESLGAACRQLVEYARGERRAFELELDLRGTEFQVSVWQQLLAIPFGRTRSYSDVARRLEQPGASRAVGAANGANPIPIIVPCHRVVARNGLGGFTGGLDLKQRLLALEGVYLPL